MPTFLHYFVPFSNWVAAAGPAMQSLQAMDVPIREGGHLRISLMGYGGHLGGMAITVPNSLAEDRKTTIIGQASEHMMSVLRLMHDCRIDLVRVAFGAFRCFSETDSPSPEWPLQMNLNGEPHADAPALLQAWRMCGAEPAATAVALLAEGAAAAMSPHYQILSLIRAIEHVLPEPAARRAHLARYNDKFAQIGISKRRFSNGMDELRTRCAHGNPIGRGATAPFAGFGFRAPPELDRLVELVRECARDAIADATGVGFWPAQDGKPLVRID